MGAVAPAYRFVPPRGYAATRNLRIGRRYGMVDRSFAIVSLVVLVALNIALPGYDIAGVPLRGLLTAGLLGVGLILYSEETLQAVQKHLLVLVLAGCLALLGVFVSIINGSSLLGIAQAVTEVHIQAALTLLVAALFARVCGARACIYIVVALVACSAAVAVFQMLGVHSAWGLRAFFARVQHESVTNLAFFERQRPMGISYSPIHLATQLCVVFGGFTALREIERRRSPGPVKPDPAVVVALGVFVVACFASGTRSPILGGVIFFALYLMLRRGSWLLLLAFFGAALLVLGWPLFMDAVQSGAPRVARVDDNSAAARLVFAYYGTHLFLDNPLGYGLLFDPTKLWGGYWTDLYLMRAAQGAQEHDLHDYVLSMLNTYGIGIVLMTPLVVRLLKSAGSSLLFFIPYVVQIMFHNAGPFYNDTIVWFIVGALSAGAAAHGAASSGAYGRPIRYAREMRPRFGASASGMVPAGSARTGFRSP